MSQIYIKRALFWESVARAELLLCLVFLFAGLVLIQYFENDTEYLTAGMLCIAESAVFLIGCHADRKEANRWTRRNKSHAENIYYGTLGSAILHANAEYLASISGEGSSRN